MKEIRKYQGIAVENVFNDLPPEWPVELLPEIKSYVSYSGHKLVVLDDDPTGTQTVHGISLLTEWSVETLKGQLSSDMPAFYILTNSRSLTPDEAQSVNSEIGRNLIEAARLVNRQFEVVSRSDSTLRGHFPGEVDALEKALERDFDGRIIMPFFPEGGRYTIDGIHYVDEGGWLMPAAETEFAKDHSFGYQSSDLRQWVEEKTGGRISADDVTPVSIRDLREGGPERASSILSKLYHNCVCVVDSVSYRDLEVFVLGLLKAEEQGKRFLYRTAASFVQVRAGLTPRPLLTVKELDLPDVSGGLIVVGSYVPRSSEQLEMLLSKTGTIRAEASVEALIDDNLREVEIERIVQKADLALSDGNDAVIYTSRDLVRGKDAAGSLAIGKIISKGLVSIVKRISTTPGYILAKGGITSSDVATEALGVKQAMVCGQILPGVPVWKLGEESRYPGLIYIVFPGNVGESNALVDIIERFQDRPL